MSKVTNALCLVKDVNSAFDYLSAKWSINSEDCNTNILIDLLFSISLTAKIPPDVTASMRAIAFALQDRLRALISDKIFKVIDSKTNEALKQHTDKLAKTQEFIDATIIAQSEATAKIVDSLTQLSDIQTSLAKSAEKLHSVSINASPPLGPRSYAQAAGAISPADSSLPAPACAFDPT